MFTHELPIHEANPCKTPLRNLGLTIRGTPLEGILQEFLRELEQRRLTGVEPKFYLSTEWGVPFGTVSIAIPFYLARSDLTKLHAERGGLVEGSGPADILRYLRHEMGHVINYAYKLYEEAEWVRLFGNVNQEYVEEYRPQPFHPDYVRHLPGWYAQKHPDEDWAETFAVWLTPDLEWRRRYAGSPAALAKLEYCDRTLNLLRGREPLVQEEELDEDVASIGSSLDDYYQEHAAGRRRCSAGNRRRFANDFRRLAGPRGLVGSGASFCRCTHPTPGTYVGDRGVPLDGVFPEHTRVLLRRLAERAEALHLIYPADARRTRPWR